MMLGDGYLDDDFLYLGGGGNACLRCMMVDVRCMMEDVRCMM